MLIDGRVFKILKLEDLTSSVSFTDWIHRNLKSQARLSREELLKSKKLLEFVKFLERDIVNQSLGNNNIEFINALKKLRSSVENESER